MRWLAFQAIGYRAFDKADRTAPHRPLPAAALACVKHSGSLRVTMGWLAFFILFFFSMEETRKDAI